MALLSGELGFTGPSTTCSRAVSEVCWCRSLDDDVFQSDSQTLVLRQLSQVRGNAEWPYPCTTWGHDSVSWTHRETPSVLEALSRPRAATAMNQSSPWTLAWTHLVVAITAIAISQLNSSDLDSCLLDQNGRRSLQPLAEDLECLEGPRGPREVEAIKP